MNSTPRKLTVLGATGGTGRQVVQQALDAGHHVTAVVRDPAGLGLSHPRLDVVTAQLTDAPALADAVAGRDAVISALGPRSRSAAGVLTRGLRATVPAMAAGGVRRLLVISAAPVGPTPPGEPLVMRYVLTPIIQRVFRDTYADAGQMEAELAASDTEWTVVRPPRLTDRPVTGRYRVEYGGNVRNGRTISRADLAHLLLRLVDDRASIDTAVGVAY